MPRRSAGDPAPTRTSSPNSSAARAIMMRWSSRGPRRQGSRIARDPHRRAWPAISLRVGRAARALKRRERSASALRNAFAVKAGDAVIAQDVIAGGVELTRLLGEEGFAAPGSATRTLRSITRPISPR